MWYVIQTMTGQEELLVDLIRRMIPEGDYAECFYIKRECARKDDGRWNVYVAALFPGYVFVDTDRPKELYQDLRGIPKLTRLLKCEDEVFLAVEEEEREFLEQIQSRGHLVRRSKVTLDEEKKIIAAEGAVGKYLEQIVKQRIRKRYVLIRQKFLGKERKIMLGIRLEEDESLEEAEEKNNGEIRADQEGLGKERLADQ